MADAVATTAGACIGMSTTTTFVESASGVTEGGRTGLTALVAAILFGLSLFLSPIFLAIPTFATAPALILVGFYMMSVVTEIDFIDASEGIPAFLTLSGMAFTYSISEGIVFGVVSYVVVNACIKKFERLNYLLVVIAILFIQKYIVAEEYFVFTAVGTIIVAVIGYFIRKKKK